MPARSPRSGEARSRTPRSGAGRAGKILADVVFGVPDNPVEPATYVTLPPPGTPSEHHALPDRDRRRRLPRHPHLDSTRIRGLVSVADIAPTLVALEAGRSPPISSEPDADAQQDLRELDTRLTRVHHDRGLGDGRRRVHDALARRGRTTRRRARRRRGGERIARCSRGPERRDCRSSSSRWPC